MWTQNAKDDVWICKEKLVNELSDLCLIIVVIVIVILLLLLLHFWYLSVNFLCQCPQSSNIKRLLCFFYCMMGKKFCLLSLCPPPECFQSPGF
jgi:hypothetical protein